MTDKKVYSIIPLNIFQTWYTLDLPSKMKEVVETLKAENREFTHYLYDDAMCGQLIQENFDDDVLYTFNKLKAGAYKADLFRYCALYVHGGIYLDIKYKCENGFSLIELTDREYFVRDRHYCDCTGIYQALISCMPKNQIMMFCIKAIVKNVCNNVYGFSELSVTGPHLMATFFDHEKIKNLALYFTGDKINKAGQVIMKIYHDYRQEQGQLEPGGEMKYRENNKNIYYKLMWQMKNIYNFPTIRSKQTFNITKETNKNINNIDVHLFSSTPSIVELTENEYLINLRWINYNYNCDGSKKNKPTQWISVNSRYKVDKYFNRITDEIFLNEDFASQKDFDGIGLEDIRMFNFEDKYYYIASFFDSIRGLTSMSSFTFDAANEINYDLRKNIILPNMYDLDHVKIYEKNWSFFEYNKTLSIVYNWFPLQIGVIDYNTQKLNIMRLDYNVPEYFKSARGSSCGVKHNNEIWFVLHKAQSYEKENTTFYNYQHFFGVFDECMNLIRYSELFKFADCKVEYCTGMIIKDTDIILSYSLLDTTSVIASYDVKYINKYLLWYFWNKKEDPLKRIDVPQKHEKNKDQTTDTNDLLWHAWNKEKISDERKSETTQRNQTTDTTNQRIQRKPHFFML